MSRGFEIDGFAFELSPLELPEACRAARLLTELVGAPLAGGGLTAESAAAALASSFERLPPLVDLFAANCKVQGESVAGGREVPLKTFKSEVFKGKLDRAILFVANCAVVELGDFLGAGLERIGSGLSLILDQNPEIQKALIRTFGGSFSHPT